MATTMRRIQWRSLKKAKTSHSKPMIMYLYTCCSDTYSTLHHELVYIDWRSENMLSTACVFANFERCRAFQERKVWFDHRGYVWASQASWLKVEELVRWQSTMPVWAVNMLRYSQDWTNHRVIYIYIYIYVISSFSMHQIYFLGP